MIRSRVRKIAIVAAVGTVATVSAVALIPFSASADGLTATTTTVTAPLTVTTGHAVTFVAAVTPFKTPAPVTKAGGTISFTVTGSDASVITCSGGNSALPLNGQGKAVCQVAPGTLLKVASPYTVSATYSGDGTLFAGSSGNFSEAVVSAKTHIKLSFDTKPASGSATTFTATVTGGPGSLPSGSVLFSVTSLSGKLAKAHCNPGGASQILSPSSGTPPVSQAVCSLAADWFKVPAPTKTNPHPVGSWTVSASYSGDANFGSSVTSMHGTPKVCDSGVGVPPEHLTEPPAGRGALSHSRVACS